MSELLTEREEAGLYLFRNERYKEWNYRCNECGVRLKIVTKLVKHWNRHHPEWDGLLSKQAAMLMNRREIGRAHV